MSTLSENYPAEKPPVLKSAICLSIVGIIGAVAWFVLSIFYVKFAVSMTIFALIFSVLFIYVSLALLNEKKCLIYFAQISLYLFIMCNVFFVSFQLFHSVFNEIPDDTWKCVKTVPLATVYATLLLSVVCQRSKQLFGVYWIYSDTDAQTNNSNSSSPSNPTELIV